MSIVEKLRFCLLGIIAGSVFLAHRAESAETNSYYRKLTLASERVDTVDPYGPLFYKRASETTTIWGFPPLFSYTVDDDIDYSEGDLLYPIAGFDRFGTEYKYHICQVFNFTGGQTQGETNVNRFTLFPFYFQQRSPIPEKNYTAFLPFHGTLKNRLFRDEVHFVMMPIYVQSRKRDMVTDNYVYPFFHLRHGDGLKGWQFWPIIGREHKEITHRTNDWGDVDLVAGHDKLFVLWPIHFNTTTGIGTTNTVKQHAILPLYTILRSPNRDSSTYFWPFGYTKTIDREKHYTEIGAPWPFIVFTHGTGKTTRRVWPFFSHASNGTVESDWYGWIAYKVNRIHSPPLERERIRILLFLFSHVSEKSTETGRERIRNDFWPFYTFHRDLNGDENLQILSILEPLLPNNKSIERNYSPLWALWRTEKSPKTGACSQSLLWNLYRRETSPEQKKLSLLFGLFRYQSGSDGRQWSLFYIPVGKKKDQTQSE
jgi:hypothetical protein